MDKTGTLTEGHAELVLGDDETLRLAASAGALSTHPLATALVDAAHQRGLALETAERFREAQGDGVEATISGRCVRVGRSSFVGGRVLMLSGDDVTVADRVASAVGLERVEAGATPQGKADVVRSLCGSGEVVAMVGDGINDAPALADVGIALAARGATISSATADVVIVVDDLARVAEAVACWRRTLRVAGQGIVLGMGLSMVLMVVAATGHLSPVGGALAQEAIDVAAIANALRALRATHPGRGAPSSVKGEPPPTTRRLATAI